MRQKEIPMIGTVKAITVVAELECRAIRMVTSSVEVLLKAETITLDQGSRDDEEKNVNEKKN